MKAYQNQNFRADKVYKFRKIMGRADFSDKFRKVIIHYKHTGYNLNMMQQSACLVINTITINNFALFDFMPIDWTPSL